MNAPYAVIIYTRYHGPTNTRGSRIVATAAGSGHSRPARSSRLSLPYDGSTTGSDPHLAAAKALFTKMTAFPLAAWQLVGIGDNPTGSGWAFVFVRATVQVAA
jgi:hypothetical protein